MIQENKESPEEPMDITFKITIDDRLIEKGKTLFLKKYLPRYLFLLLLFPFSLCASSVTIPNTFKAGDVIYADQVNENFTALEAAVNDNDARVSSNDARISNLEAKKTLIGKNGVAAYVWANQPGVAGPYTPSITFSYNPGGAISITRSTFGTYAVTFNGLNCTRGQFLVNGYTAGSLQMRVCNISNWYGSTDCTVNILCYNSTGAGLDSMFNLIYID